MHDMDRTLIREDESYGFSTNGEGELFEFQNESESEVFDENELNELASELLAVTHEGELDQFLGDVIKKAGRAVGKFVKSPIGQKLGGILKGVAKKALPVAGAALGNLVAPGVGGAIGGKLASAAGSVFGLELEGLSPEDREMEVAKQFVRLAADATKNAVTAPSTANPSQVAQKAVTTAAQKFAPGLLGGATTRLGGATTGRWVRKGTKIILLGV